MFNFFVVVCFWFSLCVLVHSASVPKHHVTPTNNLAKGVRPHSLTFCCFASFFVVVVVVCCCCCVVQLFGFAALPFKCEECRIVDPD